MRRIFFDVDQLKTRIGLRRFAGIFDVVILRNRRSIDRLRRPKIDAANGGEPSALCLNPHDERWDERFDRRHHVRD